MAYIYCADVYCDDCGKAIRKRLTAEGKAPADPGDEWSYDSDDFPKCADNDDEADTPQHCAVGKDCINAIRIGNKNDDRVGLLFGELTCDGMTYVEEAIIDANHNGYSWRSRENSVVALWYSHYSERGYRFRIIPNDLMFGI